MAGKRSAAVAVEAVGAPMMAAWRFDTATLCIEGSAGLHALFGHAAAPPDDSLAELVRHVHHDDQPTLRTGWSRLLKGEPLQCELRVRYPDGRITWLLLLGCGEQSAAQPVWRVWGVAQDITDRRLSSELHEQRRALPDLGGLGLAHIDPMNGRVLRANDRLCEMLGHASGGLVGQRYVALTDPDEHDRHAEGLRRLLRGEAAAYETEARLLRRDGTPLWALVSLALQRDGASAPLLATAAVVSIHERRGAEAALVESEERLRLACDELEARRDELQAELALAREALRREAAERLAAEQRVRQLLGRHVQAIEDERSRISRELHDTLGQHLAALGIGLKVVDDLPGRSLVAHTHLQQLRDVLSRLEDQIDRLSFELRPPALDELGLEDALRSYVESWSADARTCVEVHTHGLRTGRLPSLVETTVYRVVQEALANVRKHATARRVGVIVERRLDELRTIIEDDGRGFDPAAVAPEGGRHWGLRSMAERALLVAGLFQVESAPGSGTTVYLAIPVPGGDAPPEQEA